MTSERSVVALSELDTLDQVLFNERQRCRPRNNQFGLPASAAKAFGAVWLRLIRSNSHAEKTP